MEAEAEAEAEAKTEMGKWEGMASAEITGPTADQVWSLLQDFCNIHKWFPAMDSCHRLEDQPGMIRHCSFKKQAADGSGATLTLWANEKLVMIDPIERCLVYDVLDNNVGFSKYVATVKVVAGDHDCKIEWSFVADPVQGWQYEDLMSYVHASTQSMATAMKDALQD